MNTSPSIGVRRNLGQTHTPVCQCAKALSKRALPNQGHWLQVREHIFSVARFWLNKVGIDGWRLDVAHEIEPEFWAAFRPVCKVRNGMERTGTEGKGSERIGTDCFYPLFFEYK